MTESTMSPEEAAMKTHLGHYEIVAELGRGGMGVVYKGFEPALNRFVAIKELSPSLAHDPSLVERFLREARSMAALNDPHIIQIYFIGQEAGQPFFVMEFVEGESLSALMKREGRLTPEVALKIMHQTAQGLATAHDKGVIHRDIKPGNLMLGSRGQVKIADFGIALATHDASKKLTSTGEFVGTPGYLSPEVCLGKPVDQRSDIFALGIVLYEMLSGSSPFKDESPLGMMLEVVKAEIPDVRSLNDAVDPQCAAILGKMLAKESADRFQNCHDLAAALQAHPLVASTGPLKLPVSRPAASDATVVGAPTPISQPQRVPTPPPVVSRDGIAGAPPAVVPPPVPPAVAAVVNAPTGDDATRARASARPSVMEAQKRSGGSKVAIAIAAVLVLSAGGLMAAFHEPLLNYAKGFRDGVLGSSYQDGVKAGQVSTPINPSQAATAPADSTSSGSDTSTPLSSAAGALLSALSGGADTTSSSDPDTTRSESASTVPVLGTGSVQSGTNEADIEASGDKVLVSATTEVASAPSNREANTLGGAQAMVSASTPATTEQNQSAATTHSTTGAPSTLAKVTPPPPVAPPPPPRVVVIALGDSALTDPARQRIEEHLIARGFDIVDADMLGIDHGMALPQAIRAIRRQASAVVVVRAEPIGSQELNYYGRSSTLFSAYLGVRVFEVGDQRAVGRGFRTKVDFTSLNAEEKALEVVEPVMDELTSDLAPWRPRRRG
jgi:serine/threonine protein kinase